MNNWVAMALDAEERGDWAEAKRCWYYAAHTATDGDTRAHYNRREDRAGERYRDENQTTGKA